MIDLKKLREQTSGNPNQAGSKSPVGCSVCNNSGWEIIQTDTGEAAKRCKCYLQQKKHSKLLKLPEKFRDATYDNYRPVVFEQKKEEKLTLPSAIKDYRFSYFLSGCFGGGKTHLLAAQYRALTEAGMFSTVFISEVELLRSLQAEKYQLGIPEISLAELECRDYVHLFIDDLGKEKTTDDRIALLFNLVDMVDKKRWGLSVTSNFDLDTLQKKWNFGLKDDWNEVTVAATISRLKSICQPIYMFEVVK